MKQAIIKTKKVRHLSPVWIIPIVAVFLGLWMLFQQWDNQGVLIDIEFSNALGVDEGKTKIVLLNVQVGLVQSVHLNDNRDGVIVSALIERKYAKLMRKGSQFWVVRPRIGTSGVSGLGTLLSGAYIEMRPGSDEQLMAEFVGLSAPPVTPSGTPGQHIVLVSESDRSLSVGDSVLYRGFHVGRVESVSFDAEAQNTRYRIFIDAPFNELITTGSRFWNTSGIEFRASADGVQLQTGSLDSLLRGGVSFEVPQGSDRGEPIAASTEFQLFESLAEARKRAYVHYIEYVLLFEQSVRGLSVGAPVEYRGIRVGSVSDVRFAESVEDETYIEDLNGRIPVKIRIEPARLGFGDNEKTLAEAREDLIVSIQGGLRASIKTGNLLTGRKYISFDIYPQEPQEPLKRLADMAVFPTVNGGFDELNSKLSYFLDSLNQLPLETLVSNANGVLSETEALAKSLQNSSNKINSILANDSTQSLSIEAEQTLVKLQAMMQDFSEQGALYQQLNETLRVLNHSVKQLEPVIQTLQDQPNALIFNRSVPNDPQPGSN